MRRSASAVLIPNRVIGIFITGFLGSTSILQLWEDTPPWYGRSAIDLMNGSLIWMLSVLALLCALQRLSRPNLDFAWLLGSAAPALVAIDELFEFHERTENVGIDDDRGKIFLVLCAGIGVAAIIWIERLRGITRAWLCAGYCLHIPYLMADIGDGDFFEMPFISLDALRVT